MFGSGHPIYLSIVFFLVGHLYQNQSLFSDWLVDSSRLVCMKFLNGLGISRASKLTNGLMRQAVDGGSGIRLWGTLQVYSAKPIFRRSIRHETRRLPWLLHMMAALTTPFCTRQVEINTFVIIRTMW